MSALPSRNTLHLVALLCALCLSLQQIDVPYYFEKAGQTRQGSLIHLHMGLLLAVTMLSQRRDVVVACFVAGFAGWFWRQWQSGGMSTLFFAMGLVNWLFAFGWTVFCARRAGWPRGSRLVRLHTRDLGRFALFCLLLYPLGLALFAGFTVASLTPTSGMATAYPTFISKCFGVLVLTLPLVVSWSERRAARHGGRRLRAAWAWVALAIVLAWLVRQPAWVEIVQRFEFVTEYRFALFVLLGALILRLTGFVRWHC